MQNVNYSWSKSSMFSQHMCNYWWKVHNSRKRVWLWLSSFFCSNSSQVCFFQKRQKIRDVWTRSSEALNKQERKRMLAEPLCVSHFASTNFSCCTTVYNIITQKAPFELCWLSAKHSKCCNQTVLKVPNETDTRNGQNAGSAAGFIFH